LKLKILAASLLIVGCDLIVVLAQQQQPKGTIEGTVVSATNGNPILGARVTVSAGTGDARPSFADQLMSAIAGSEPVDLTSQRIRPGAPFARGRTMPSVTTQADGKFSLELEAGVYRIIADANGYAPAELGQRGPVGMGTPIYLESGQTASALTLRMTPTGVVTGRIADAAGMPAEQVPVQVLRATYTRLGQRMMDVGAVAVTNDRGEYRLYGITPGRYYLNAGSMVVSDAATIAVGRVFFEGIDPQAIPRAQALTQIYALTYYPGVTDLNRATPIDVRSGEEARADMIVRRDTRHSVSGRVIDSSTGKPTQDASISLTYHTRTGGTSSTGERIDPVSGTFSFRDVIPAAYTLRAQGRVVPPAGARGADSLAAQMAAQVAAEMAAPTVTVPVNVSGDVENVVLTISPSVPLVGRLTVNGEPPSSLPDFDRLRPGLRQFIDGGMNPIGPSVQVSADGSFHFEGIREDDYKFAITGLPPGLYVEKAEIKGVDLLSDSIHVSGSPPGLLEVVLQRGTGTINGTVKDGQSRSAAGVQVVLVPEQRGRLDLYRTTMADKTGRFSFTEVPPVNYRLFSWEAIAPNSYYDPDVLSRYEARGHALRVAQSSSNAVDVNIIPVEP